MKRKNWIELTCLVGVLGTIIIGADSAKALKANTELTGKVTNIEYSPDFQALPDCLGIVSFPIEMSYGNIQGKRGLNKFQGNTEYIGIVDSRNYKSDWKLTATLANTWYDGSGSYECDINVSKPLRMKNYAAEYTGGEDFPFIALPETLMEFPQSEENVTKQFEVPEKVSLTTYGKGTVESLLSVKFEKGNNSSFGIGLPISLGDMKWYPASNYFEEYSFSNNIIWTIATGI